MPRTVMLEEPQVRTEARPVRQFTLQRVHFLGIGGRGKPAITAMPSFALLECQADPSSVIGGTVSQLGGSSRSGTGDAFIVEACEFDRSFHSLCPTIAVITNIEADHLDCYTHGLDEI